MIKRRVLFAAGVLLLGLTACGSPADTTPAASPAASPAPESYPAPTLPAPATSPESYPAPSPSP